MVQAIARFGSGRVDLGHQISVKILGTAFDRILDPAYDLDRVFQGRFSGAREAIQSMREALRVPVGEIPRWDRNVFNTLNSSHQDQLREILHAEERLNTFPQEARINRGLYRAKFENRILNSHPRDITMAELQFTWSRESPIPSGILSLFQIDDSPHQLPPLLQFRGQMTEFLHQPLQDTAIRLHADAVDNSPTFGAWYYLLHYTPDMSTVRSRITSRQGLNTENWLGGTELGQVTSTLHTYLFGLEKQGIRAPRILLLGGDDTGSISIETVYDDDPTLDQWDFDTYPGPDLVNKAVPVLDIWPTATTPTEHILQITIPCREQARCLTNTKDFGTLYGVINLDNPDQPILRTQIRTSDGHHINDWTDPDLTRIITHNTRRYRTYYTDNDYPDWTTATFAIDDNGNANFKATTHTSHLTDPDPTTLIEETRPTLDM